MEIQIDSREKAKAIQKILAEFDSQGIKYFTSKLFCGDYQSLDNARLCIDRKQSLSELCNNLGQKHAQFKAELMRAQEMGIKMIVLCEHGGKIKSFENVAEWINPRQKTYEKKIRESFGIKKELDFETEVTELKSHGAKIQKPPMSGAEISQKMITMSERYGVEWLFCTKPETGRRIIELLGGDT